MDCLEKLEKLAKLERLEKVTSKFMQSGLTSDQEFVESEFQDARSRDECSGKYS